MTAINAIVPQNPESLQDSPLELALDHLSINYTVYGPRESKQVTTKGHQALKTIESIQSFVSQHLEFIETPLTLPDLGVVINSVKPSLEPTVTVQFVQMSYNELAIWLNEQRGR